MDINPMRNILINSPADKLNKSLFLIAYKYAERGQKILYIATKPLDKMPSMISSATSSTTILQNIIFKYHTSHNALLKTLLELHTWKYSPRLIIIESLQLFYMDADNLITFKEFSQDHAVIIAALQNIVYSLATDDSCFSIISLDSNENTFMEYYQELLQTLIDLYYFKEGAFIQMIGDGDGDDDNDVEDIICDYIDGNR